MLLFYFFLPFVLLLIIIFAGRIVIKFTSYLSSYHPNYKAVTILFRLLLFILFLFSIKSCSYAYLEKLFAPPPNQAFNSELWKNKQDMNNGAVRHSMLESLEKNHTFLLGKSQTQVIEILGEPDIDHSKNDSTLHYRAFDPSMFMGTAEHIEVYFRKNKSYRINFSYHRSEFH